MATGFGFPFGVTPDGMIARQGGEDAGIRGKIVQVLFTAPGERVNQPDFGCGLLNLVFDPNNTILAAAVEFTASQSLARWLGREIAVSGVDITARDEMLTVEVAYVRRRDAARQAVRIQFR
ncbi:GPW/gp25 family protein [Arthrobacter sp. I2-34]|uniref:GPW/gp25 family protein n=1 Tax=Arthrobacter hankyongi TaxID=2904801 RepID=A0ABS9L766_9MICC|nr:GPW/gp25 family protein [Arthrobacter hankyongi]MCG2622423.1 GPW/gp25 family protein [Arthrobacter hankyongi]